MSSVASSSSTSATSSAVTIPSRAPLVVHHRHGQQAVVAHDAGHRLLVGAGGDADHLGGDEGAHRDALPRPHQAVPGDDPRQLAPPAR